MRMRNSRSPAVRVAAFVLGTSLAWSVAAGLAMAAEATTWQLVNPEGVVVVDPVPINPHPATLEGKTILLFWNGKHNGDNFLDRIAELLSEQVPTARIVKSWEPPLNVPAAQNVSANLLGALKKAGIRPDLAIASQAD